MQLNEKLAVIPVDVGVRNLATTIENETPKFYGSEINEVRQKYRVATNQWMSADKWSEQDRRIVRHQARIAAISIVETARRQRAIIALGQPNTCARYSSWYLSYWPVKCFIQHLRAKAVRLGVPVVDVPEWNTSHRCSQCGARGYRLVMLFACPNCGANMDSDANAALNIRQRAQKLLLNMRRG